MGKRINPRLNSALVSGLVAAVALGIAPPGRANWMWLGGGETVFDGEYAATTVLLPLSGQLGKGFVHRYNASYIRYEYPQDEDTVRGESRGLAAALGYQIPISNGWFGLYAGVAYRDTDFDPPQPDSPLEGARFVPQFDVEGGRLHANRWLYAATASYAPDDRAYWLRGRLLRRATMRIFVGPEVIAHGDRDYDAQQAGLAVQLNQIIGPFDIVLKIGRKRIEDGERGDYGGIELLRHFQ